MSSSLQSVTTAVTDCRQGQGRNCKYKSSNISAFMLEAASRDIASYKLTVQIASKGKNATARSDCDWPRISTLFLLLQRICCYRPWNIPHKTGNSCLITPHLNLEKMNITDYIILFVMPQEEIFLHRQTFHKLNIYSILHSSCKITLESLRWFLG